MGFTAKQTAPSVWVVYDPDELQIGQTYAAGAAVYAYQDRWTCDAHPHPWSSARFPPADSTQADCVHIEFVKRNVPLK